MSLQYGVQTQNRFFLALDEESDPFECIEREEARATALKEKKEKPVPQKSQPGVKSAPKPKPKPKTSTVNITYDSVAEPAVKPVNGDVKKKPPQKEPEAKEPASKPRSAKTNDKRKQDKENVKTQFEDKRVSDQAPRRGFREHNKEEASEGTGFGGFNSGFGSGTTSNFSRGGGRVFRGNRGGRGRGGGGRGGFGEFGQRGNRDNRGEDRMERHSGSTKTGVKSVDKREGHGKHNWGTEADDLKAEEDLQAEERERGDGEFVAQPDDDDKPKNADTKEEKPAESEPEPEVTMTMDEYKKKLAEERQKVQSEFNIRKPGEGESSKMNKDFVVLKKYKDEEVEEVAQEENEHQQAPKDNMLKELFRFNYEETRRNVGGPGPRGQGRGFRNRGGRRNEGRGGKNLKADEAKFDLTNDESFPTLS